MLRKRKDTEETGTKEPKLDPLVEPSTPKVSPRRRTAKPSARHATSGTNKSEPKQAGASVSKKEQARTPIGEIAVRTTPAEPHLPESLVKRVVEKPDFRQTGKSTPLLEPEDSRPEPATTWTKSVETSTETPASVPPQPLSAPSADSIREQIAQLAYSYWEARGHQHGNSQEDWLRAEQEVLGRMQAVKQKP